MSWYLDDVYELNKEAPYTFYLPSPEVLGKLKVGDLVKLIFVTKDEEEDGFHGERMWVEITEMNEGKLIGKLDNEPYRLSLKIGDEISFGVENICDTEYDDPASSDWDFYFDTKVIVSNDVIEKEDSILEFLEEPPLCAYERNDKGSFYKIEDYDWDTYLNG